MRGEPHQDVVVDPVKELFQTHGRNVRQYRTDDCPLSGKAGARPRASDIELSRGVAEFAPAG